MKIVHEVPTPLPEADEGTPDGLVIARSRAEPEQFALLFRRHAGGIGRYAARRLGPGAAEDIVAETFLAAFRHRDRYDVTRPDALPWLYGIAGNLIRRHARDEVRMLRALARTGLDPVAESFTDRSDAPDGRGRHPARRGRRARRTRPRSARRRVAHRLGRADL